MDLKTPTVIGMCFCALGVALPFLGYAAAQSEMRWLVTFGIYLVTFAPLLCGVLILFGLVLMAPGVVKVVRKAFRGHRPDA